MNPFPSISIMIPNLQAGDDESWNELCRRFMPGLTAKARSLLRNSNLEKRVEAEELATMALTRAWKTCERIQATTTAQFAKYMLTILNRLFIDQCRPKNFEESSPSWFLPTSHDPTNSEVLMNEEFEAKMHAAVAELPEKYREVIFRRYFENQKLREVAEAMGITTSAAAGLARQGLKLLKQRLDSFVDTELRPGPRPDSNMDGDDDDDDDRGSDARPDVVPA